MNWHPLPIPSVDPADPDTWGAQYNGAIQQIRSRINNAGRFTPPVGAYQLPTGLVTTSTTAPTSGHATFNAIDIEREATFSHVAYRIATNRAGGNTNFTAAIYADNGEGNSPDTSQRLAYTPTPDPLTSGPDKELALDAPITLTPGRYWIGSLYYAASAPSTNPTLHSVDGLVFGWLDSGNLWFFGAHQPRCLYIESQASLPTTALTLSVGRSQAPPIVALKRSA